MKIVIAIVLFPLLAWSGIAAGSPVGREDIYLLNLKWSADDQRVHGFRPRGDLEPWPLKTPIDWGADPFSDRNWQFQLNAWRMTDPLLLEYFQTQDPALLAEAMQFVDDWHHFHLIDGQSHEYSWYDMGTGIRALRIAFFLDAGNRGLFPLKDGQMGRLLELADEHARRLQDDEFIAINNHGLFQVAGLYLLCEVARDRSACEHGQEFAQEKYDEILRAQFTEEGVHTENSPSYHFFVRNLLRSLGALKRMGHIDLLQKIDAVAPWLVFPNGKVARIGDSGSTSLPLKDDPEEPACLSDKRCFAVSDLTRSGYAVVRSLPSENQTSMLFVAGMAHNTIHKHADELSFELFEFRRMIFIDSGKYAYKRGPFRTYVQSAAAHNTLSLSDRHIRPSEVELSGSLLVPIKQTASGFAIEGQVERPDLFHQRRQITYDPGRSINIVDHLSADEEMQFVSSLHLAPDLIPKLSEDGFEVAADEHIIHGKVIEDDCSLSVARGQQEPTMLGWQTSGYAEMSPTSVIMATCPGRERTISWSILFD